jgi:hypothetical protein
MKSISTALIFCSSLTSALAQFPYDFSILNQPYTELQNPIPLTTASWDDPSLTVQLGFEFHFLGSTTNNLYFDLGLGGLLVPDFTGTTMDMIMAYNSDIIDAGFNTNEMLSPISYLVAGDPGSRICKIQWKNVAFYNEVVDLGTALNRANFQLWIYEGSDIVEVRFGDNTISSESFGLVHDNMGPMIGFVEDLNLMEDSFAAMYLLQGNPTSATVSTWAIYPEGSSFLSDDPGSGIVYRFAPNSVVNVTESKASPSFMIYPQPAQDQCRLIFPEHIDFLTIQLFDMAGREVLTYAGNSSAAILNVAQLNPGVYLAHVKANGREYTQKLLRN